MQCHSELVITCQKHLGILHTACGTMPSAGAASPKPVSNPNLLAACSACAEAKGLVLLRRRFLKSTAVLSHAKSL